MLKKLLCLTLALLFCLPALAESVVVNKVANPDDPFAFPEGAQLLEVYFPDIHGCDAALVRLGDQTMLIDAATSDQAPKVRALLDSLGVTSLTYAMNSHPDNDHISGFFQILPDIPSGEFLTGFPDVEREEPLQEKLLARLAEMGIPHRRVAHGETFAFGDAQATVIQSFDPKVEGINNNSAMLRIQYGDRAILFTGDVQKIAQLAIIEDETTDLSADIEKFPHHGYDRMQKGFLERVDPEIVIFTAGYVKDSRAVKQIKDYGAAHLYTYQGVLKCATDGRTWVVERLP